jgi:hypothetical protein
MIAPPQVATVTIAVKATSESKKSDRARLLGDAQASHLLWWVRHAGLAAGEQETTGLDAACGPASRRPRTRL